MDTIKEKEGLWKYPEDLKFSDYVAGMRSLRIELCEYHITHLSAYIGTRSDRQAEGLLKLFESLKGKDMSPDKVMRAMGYLQRLFIEGGYHNLKSVRNETREIVQRHYRELGIEQGTVDL